MVENQNKDFFDIIQNLQDTQFIPQAYSFDRDYIYDEKESFDFQFDLFTVSRDFIVFRTENMQTLKIRSLHDISINNQFSHQYQISDAKFYKEYPIIASCDISGQIYVWKININDLNLKCSILLQCKYEDDIQTPLLISWKNYNTFCTYNQNLVSIWTYSHDPQSSTPNIFFSNQFKDTKIRQLEFSRQNNLIYLLTNPNKITLINSNNLQIINEFEPFNDSQIKYLQTFDNKKNKQRDIFIVINQFGLLKVYDQSIFNENTKKYSCIQKFNIQSKTLEYEQIKSDIQFHASFDPDQSYFFILIQENNIYLLKRYNINQYYQCKSKGFIDNLLEIQSVKKKLFDEQNIYQISGQGVLNMQINSVYKKHLNLYFQQELLQQNANINDEKIYSIYTINSNNINVNFINSEKYQINNQIEDLETEKLIQIRQKDLKERIKLEKFNNLTRLQMISNAIANQDMIQSLDEQENLLKNKIDNLTEIQKYLEKEIDFDDQIDINDINDLENFNEDEYIQNKIFQNIDLKFDIDQLKNKINQEIQKSIFDNIQKQYQQIFQMQVKNHFQKYLEVFQQQFNILYKNHENNLNETITKDSKNQHLEIIQITNSQFKKLQELYWQKLYQIQQQYLNQEDQIIFLVKNINQLQKNQYEIQQKQNIISNQIKKAKYHNEIEQKNNQQAFLYQFIKK